MAASLVKQWKAFAKSISSLANMPPGDQQADARVAAALQFTHNDNGQQMTPASWRKLLEAQVGQVKEAWRKCPPVFTHAAVI